MSDDSPLAPFAYEGLDPVPEPKSTIAEVSDRGASCPVCQDQMMLTNIKPSRFGFDLRTFKCDNCNHTEKFAIETNAQKPDCVDA